MAVTDASTTPTPLAVPEVELPARAIQRVVRAVRPPTLGDKLHEVLRIKGQTTAQAAHAMGVTTAEVLAWSADTEVPGSTVLAALRTYLEVDDRQLRGLVLRGQMRFVQARIRT